jgi:CheY-like chemotaxis protein
LIQAAGCKPILVVEDDQDIREVVALALDAMGYSAVLAADGLEAIDLLSSGLRPSLILLDMMMPRMDGEAFLAAVRKNAETANIPIVLVSGHHAVRQRAAELHASGCLVKPIELDDLAAIVDRFVRGARTEPQREAQSEPVHR